MFEMIKYHLKLIFAIILMVIVFIFACIFCVCLYLYDLMCLLWGRVKPIPTVFVDINHLDEIPYIINGRCVNNGKYACDLGYACDACPYNISSINGKCAIYGLCNLDIDCKYCPYYKSLKEGR